MSLRTGVSPLKGLAPRLKATQYGGAAVIGVESGPVDIAYRDTDGKAQTLSILIDTVPPTVQIDTPVHKSEGQDTSPNFSGSYTDDNSGLRKGTFRLYVDHNDDPEREAANGPGATTH